MEKGLNELKIGDLVIVNERMHNLSVVRSTKSGSIKSRLRIHIPGEGWSMAGLMVYKGRVCYVSKLNKNSVSIRVPIIQKGSGFDEYEELRVPFSEAATLNVID